MLTSVAMMCACRKKNSAAQEQLTQPKRELGAREEAMAGRLNSLEEQVNRLNQRMDELAAKERDISARTSGADVQGQFSDPAQLEAEKQRMIQQLSTMIPNRSQAAAGDPAKQERTVERQLGPEDLQRQWQDKAKTAGKAVFPAAEAASVTPSGSIDTTSPPSSATPE